MILVLLHDLEMGTSKPDIKHLENEPCQVYSNGDLRLTFKSFMKQSNMHPCKFKSTHKSVNNIFFCTPLMQHSFKADLKKCCHRLYIKTAIFDWIVVEHIFCFGFLQNSYKERLVFYKISEP